MAVTSQHASGEDDATQAPKRLLVVSWTLPPTLTGSSVIVENLSHQYSRDDMALIGEAPANANQYRRDKNLPPVHYVTKEMTWPKRGRKYVRWTRWMTLPGVVRRMSQIARDARAEAILAVFPNEFFLYAAYQVGQRLNLPIYPYLHNTYRENRSGAALRFANWLEPRVFRRAPAVFVMSDGLKSHYEAIYPDVRFESLVHSFSESLPDFVPAPPMSSPLRLAFLGNLNDSNVDASRRLAEVVNARPDCVLTIYSGTPEWFYTKVGVVGPRISNTRVSYDQVTEALQGHDILVLPHGFSGGMSQLEYDTIFPTRTISYLTSNRPILAHSPPDCFLTRWLRQHDCAEIVDKPDPGLLAAAVERLQKDSARREYLVRNALRAARQFHGPVVAGRMRQVMAETMSVGNRTTLPHANGPMASAGQVAPLRQTTEREKP